MHDKTSVVCFVTTGCASVDSLLHGSPTKSVTGPDIAFIGLIGGMRKANNRVEVVVSEGEEHREDYNGLVIYHLGLVSGAGRPFIFVERMIKTIKSILKCESSTIYHSEGLAGTITIFSKLLGKKVVFGVASDAIVKPLMNGQTHGLLKILNVFESWVNIKFSDVVIVQTCYQALEVKKNYARETILIRTSYEAKNDIIKKENVPRVVWIGAMADIKQPWLCLELAKKIPHVEFLMIGGPSADLAIYNKIANESQKIPNLKMLGHINPKEIDQYIADSSILINTSLLEGFPHAFVQAWAQSVPVISLNADPDELLERKKIGYRAGSMDRMVNQINQLLNNEALRRELGENAKKHYLQEHNHDENISRYVALFEMLTRKVSE